MHPVPPKPSDPSTTIHLQCCSISSLHKRLRVPDKSWSSSNSRSVDESALRGVVLCSGCNALHSVRRCCTALQRADAETDSERTTTHSSVQPIERFTPRASRLRTRHTFPHRPMPVVALACAGTNVCGDCRLCCSAPPTSEGKAVCRTRREHASRAAPGFRIGFDSGLATPRHSGVGGREGRRGQVEASSVEHAGLCPCRCGG